jgi:DNA helicase-2/ATP-dependent DNA helicase PcrA
MQGVFEKAYAQLNSAQKEAVDTIEGPVLVVAGPGTGKTQLLSMRVANILQQTDVAPSSILCLTFTDNAARNMRERLETIIGRSAYHVAIHTFHSFGGEIINQFPDYFSERQLLQQVDELGRYELLRAIFEKLPHSNPLSVKVGDDFVHLKDALDTISWLKQNALKPTELDKILLANKTFYEAIGANLAKTFTNTPSTKELPAYKELLHTMSQQATGGNRFGFPEYAAVCSSELKLAIEATEPSGRYATQITAWRNSWCSKDIHGHHVFKDDGRNLRKLRALANVYENLLQVMAKQGLYDFDDMIIEVVHALETHSDLRFSLQERYQYILVDEFQDTNKAQLRILQALGDNPVNERRPNILAVGDDDQAIYAFQGAEVSNMIAFTKLYNDPVLITLVDSYRSTSDILDASFAVAEQITDRLEAVLPNTHKQPITHANHTSQQLEHAVFTSELAQYDWIATQIERHIKQGIKPEAIAVIAPRHKYLERLMPYVGSRHIPVAYERRESVLDAPIIVQLLTMAELVNAIAGNHQHDIDVLMSTVLGYDFWALSAEKLLAISLRCYDTHEHWLPILLQQDDITMQRVARWFMELAKQSSLEPMEYMLDQLLGAASDGIDNEYDDLSLPVTKPDFVSPMCDFYFNSERFENATDTYLALLGQLSTLRQHVRQWRPNTTLHIKDLIEFAALHTSAQLKIVDINPHTQTTSAVQVMTVYKAKGLEFEVVFVINAQDEIWGPNARSRSPRIALPKNLPIAPNSDGNNDKLRLLFVALTRAKHTLYITSYTHNLDNKLSSGLSFIGGNNPSGVALIEGLTPKLIARPATSATAQLLTHDWAYRFRQVIANKSSLFEPVLANYQLSVTHLNNFIDITTSGPAYFFLHNLLRFPEATTPAAAYGDAIHKSLQWTHSELKVHAVLPPISNIQSYFADLLARKHLRPSDHQRLADRGHKALELYFKNRASLLTTKDIVERGFSKEGVVINTARLSGKIDKLHFANQASVQVIDFKTGKPAQSWHGKDVYEQVKLHKYHQQLLFYKLLVENSASFKGRVTAESGALEFLEADEEGRLVENLELTYTNEDIEHFIALIGAVWQHIMQLNMPDVASYAKNLAGIKQFEQDLIDNTI